MLFPTAMLAGTSRLTGSFKSADLFRQGATLLLGLGVADARDQLVHLPLALGGRLDLPEARQFHLRQPTRCIWEVVAVEVPAGAACDEFDDDVDRALFEKAA